MMGVADYGGQKTRLHSGQPSDRTTHTAHKTMIMNVNIHKLNEIDSGVSVSRIHTRLVHMNMDEVIVGATNTRT